MLPIEPNVPLEEMDATDSPLGVSCLRAEDRGRIVNLFIMQGDLYIIIEPNRVIAIDRSRPDAFLLKAGETGGGPQPVCNFGHRFIGRMLTDARLYAEHLEIEIDLGHMGVDVNQRGIFAWTRPKPPAIN